MERRKVLVLCSVITLSLVAAWALLFMFYEMERFENILSAADKIGELRLLPDEDYWKERIAADKEDEANGYHSSLSYPGHRISGSVSIMGKIKRPDTSKLGPRSKACEEKWKPILERNLDLSNRRVQEISSLHGVLLQKKPELGNREFESLCSNVVRRARLAPREVELLLRGK